MFNSPAFVADQVIKVGLQVRVHELLLAVQAIVCLDRMSGLRVHDLNRSLIRRDFLSVCNRTFFN